MFTKARLFAMAATVVALSACAGHFHSVPQGNVANSIGARSSLSLQGRSDERRLFTQVDQMGRTPDQSYQIRTIHLVGVKLHQISSYVTPNGTFTQQEYSSPFGLLTVMQSEVREAPPLSTGTTQASLPSKAVKVRDFGNGTTSHGGTWQVTTGLKPGTNHVHLQFGDSMFDADVPASVDLQTLRTLLETVY